MKVCILTYRLHSNFGFLMQAYALQETVKALGHEPYTVDIRVKPLFFTEKIKQIIKSVLLYISRKTGFLSLPWITAEEQSYIDQYTWSFVTKYLQLTPPVNSIRDLKRLLGNRYDFYLVGSDQVWRKEYCPNLPSYFLDFVQCDKKRASYAASFGVSDPSYPPKMIEKCKKQLSKFSAVSVRESDGVNICRELFGITAEQVLDPTLLLDKMKYVKLIEPIDAWSLPSCPFILAYILDKTPEKLHLVKEISHRQKMEVYYIKPEDINEVGIKRIEECIYPPVSVWLSAFERSSFVITDSFHGTVFSIIFRKQFVALNNPQRGSSRIKSLLHDFSLENRLVPLEGNKGDQFEVIDYSKIDNRLAEKKEKSVSFLKKVLNE